MTGNLFAGRDGAELVFHETGSGRPLIVLHGYMGAGPQLLSAWAGPFAGQGRRIIAPDFRGHGGSARPHDPAAYPPDVLADDGLALVEHLGLGDGDYDLGGYSLGARIVLRLLVRGARPGRAIVAGQGLAKVSGPQGEESSRVLTALLDGTDSRGCPSPNHHPGTRRDRRPG
jgi:pimeloyl-ACP methyl ester carboxylesterase